MSKLLFTFSNCLRHAFLTGAGYGDLERISDEDLLRWVEYDPSELTPFVKMQASINAHDELLAGLRAAEKALREEGFEDDADVARTLLAKHGGDQ